MSNKSLDEVMSFKLKVFTHFTGPYHAILALVLSISRTPICKMLLLWILFYSRYLKSSDLPVFLWTQHVRDNEVWLYTNMVHEFSQILIVQTFFFIISSVFSPNFCHDSIYAFFTALFLIFWADVYHSRPGTIIRTGSRRRCYGIFCPIG
jgi:hypothetical protein